MVPCENSWSIIIVGYWNRMIFSPEWVARHLFERATIECLVSTIPSQPIIYRSNDVEMRVLDTRLEFILRKYTPNCLSNVEQIICRVFNMLPQTPIQSIGINFGYVQSDPDVNLLEMFNFSDDANIGIDNWEIQNKEIHRTLKHDRESYALNAKYSLINQYFVVNLNFHQDVNAECEAKVFISEQVINRYNEGIALLDNTMNLQLEEGADAIAL